MDSLSRVEMIAESLRRLTRYTMELVKQTGGLIAPEGGGARESAWSEIEKLEVLVEEIKNEVLTQALMLIARNQPLGRELMLSQTILNAAYDAFRISRYCRELARIDKILHPGPGLSGIPGLRDVFSLVERAVSLALNDLNDLEPNHAGEIDEIDKVVDEEYFKLLREINSREQVKSIEAFRLLAMRHIERIVDHTVYIENSLRLTRAGGLHHPGEPQV
ncbi:MAG: phosphate uptake regulator PhoU [Thermosphaera sp.]